MHEPPKSKQLPGNPYADYAQAHMDPALATLALAYEIAQIRRILDPHDDRRSNNELGSTTD